MKPLQRTGVLPDDLSEVLSHLEAAWPKEGCGLVLRDGTGRLRVRPMENAYDRYRAADPERYPRTSRTAYAFAAREQIAVEREQKARGERTVCIFHSHVEVGAYFSAEDEAQAAPEGLPLFPGVAWLVVAVNGGRTTAAKLYRWTGSGFEGEDVPLEVG